MDRIGLSFDPARLALVVRDAETVVAALRPACEAFLAQVAASLAREADDERARPE
jgi:hypothetical protein